MDEITFEVHLPRGVSTIWAGILHVNAPLKLLAEWLVIQKDVWVVIMPIEAILHLLNGIDNVLEVTVPGQNDKRGIRFSHRSRPGVFI